MDEENYTRNDKSVDGNLICKSASVETQNVTEEDLKKINRFALEGLKQEEVFCFKLIMGDNELDDRNYEPFNLNALKDLEKLYIGKTMIKDHRRLADNQIARIYETELRTSEKLTGANEIHTELIAKCYMVKTASNVDLISEIKAGIKKEVSTGCTPKHAFCSICGADNTKTYCQHYWGKEYETKDGKKICYFTLDGAKEAYEVSFVAVPAQPRAGTTKNYGGKIEEMKNETEKSKKDKYKESKFSVELKYLDSFIFEEKERKNNE